MATMKMAMAVGTGDGGDLTLDDVSKYNDGTYTFAKDFKYVIAFDKTSGSSTTFGNSFVYNGVAFSADVVEGSYKVDSTRYGIYAIFKDVKAGDTLACTVGSWSALLLGFN